MVALSRWTKLRGTAEVVVVFTLRGKLKHAIEVHTWGLARIRWLFVIARSSSFLCKYRALDVKQARASSVSATCSKAACFEPASRAGNRLRISAQLVDATTGHHWAERYDRQIGDIFAVQDEITAVYLPPSSPICWQRRAFAPWRGPPKISEPGS